MAIADHLPTRSGRLKLELGLLHEAWLLALRASICLLSVAWLPFWGRMHQLLMIADGGLS